MGARKPIKPPEEPQENPETEEAAETTKPSRARREKVRGKKHAARAGKAPREPLPLTEAVKRVKELSYASFDASIDAHITLGLEPGNQEHQIRTFVSLPHGTGKEVRVLVFAEPALAKKAEAAGAGRIGDEELIEEIAAGKIPPADTIVATPAFMPRIAKAAKVLGPKGLMPSPKTGTVTEDPAKTVAEIKKGKAEIRTEARPIVHVSIGKVSFADEKLIENLRAVVEELDRMKPGKIKDVYLKSITLAPTMGPSVGVSLDSF